MKEQLPILKCSDVNFYSPLDEETFFYALKKISAVKKITGRGRDLFLTMSLQPSDKALRELLGLFFRYKIDMRELELFLTDKNRPWFYDTKKYWFKKVFPKK